MEKYFLLEVEDNHPRSPLLIIFHNLVETTPRRHQWVNTGGLEAQVGKVHVLEERGPTILVV